MQCAVILAGSVGRGGGASCDGGGGDVDGDRGRAGCCGALLGALLAPAGGHSQPRPQRLGPQHVCGSAQLRYSCLVSRGHCCMSGSSRCSGRRRGFWPMSAGCRACGVAAAAQYAVGTACGRRIVHQLQPPAQSHHGSDAAARQLGNGRVDLHSSQLRHVGHACTSVG